MLGWLQLKCRVGCWKVVMALRKVIPLCAWWAWHNPKICHWSWFPKIQSKYLQEIKTNICCQNSPCRYLRDSSHCFTCIHLKCLSEACVILSIMSFNISNKTMEVYYTRPLLQLVRTYITCLHLNMYHTYLNVRQAFVPNS